MENSLFATDLLTAMADRPLLDVRSPGEFAQGHVPGAISFPLFSDAERAAVGTSYKQRGPEPAFELGLNLVGPKLAGFVREARKLAPAGTLAIYCWRGGQRSGSMAWLLRQAGMEVDVLAGGYKAFRTQVLQELNTRPFSLRVIGGRTGSGKTKILHALRELGEQIIDLEGLACHKGSAFGFIGEPAQPTVEQFENNLYAALQKLEPGRRIWVENESRSIGRVFVPAGFWEQMHTAPLLSIQIPQALRVGNLVNDYVGTAPAELETAFLKISTKLGGQHLKAALEALRQNDYRRAAEIALGYYDKTYQHGLDTNRSLHFQQLEFDHGDPAAIALQLTELAEA